jgi:hypothetical protein
MTTVATPKPKLQDANLTSVVGLTLAFVPFVGFIVSTVSLFIARRERSHPGFALIGMAVGAIAIMMAVGTTFAVFQTAGALGFDVWHTYSPDELEAFYNRISKG